MCTLLPASQRFLTSSRQNLNVVTKARRLNTTLQPQVSNIDNFCELRWTWKKLNESVVDDLFFTCTRLLCSWQPGDCLFSGYRLEWAWTSLRFHHSCTRAKIGERDIISLNFLAQASAFCYAAQNHGWCLRHSFCEQNLRLSWYLSTWWTTTLLRVVKKVISVIKDNLINIQNKCNDLVLCTNGHSWSCKRGSRYQ